MADSSATSSNGFNTPVMILLVLNLLATLAMLAHVVYYIPESGSSSSESAEPQLVTNLLVDGVRHIGMGPNGVELEMMELNDNNPTGAPRVMQTVTMSQEAFLKTLQRMSLLRDRMVEKELVREVE